MTTLPLRSLHKWGLLILLLLIGFAGIYLRIATFGQNAALATATTDEQLYSLYVTKIGDLGVLHYPKLVDLYLQDQKQVETAFLPPTRLSFFLAAAAWHSIFHGSSLEAVRTVSLLASLLLLIIATIFAWRVGGVTAGLGMAVLMTVAPTQLYMAHRAMIDGFFGCITALVLWFLWETLQNPRAKGWLWAYAASLCLLVITKENAAFVYFAILGILATNRWLRFGTISKPLLIATLAAPVVAGGILILCAGGLEPLFTVFLLNIQKSYHLPYAIRTGDGPWFRYLSDLFLVSPAVMLFAIGGAFMTRLENKSALYLLAFVFFSYLVMCHLRYGMNLRYANMWDFPLRGLALVPILHWSKAVAHARWQIAFLGLTLAFLVWLELGNYFQIFIAHPISDPLPPTLLWSLDMYKPQV